MSLLITGATGCIGHHLVQMLAESTPLTLLVRKTKAAAPKQRMERLLSGPAREALRRGNIRLFEGDISLPGLGLCPERRKSLLDSLTGIVHLAARTDFEKTQPSEFHRVNVEGTRRLADMAREVDCPFYLMSTAYISGDHAGVFTEEDYDVGQSFSNAYERSKWNAEAVVRDLAKGGTFSYVILRPGIVFPDFPTEGVSPGPGPLVYLKLLANCEGRNGSRKRLIRIEGNPDGLLNLVPMSFVVRAIRAVLERPIPDRRTYHLTAGRSFTQSEIAKAANELLEGIRALIQTPEEIRCPDRIEELLDRHCRVYKPYLHLRTTYGRGNLLADLGPDFADDGADAGWLRRVFGAHLRSWRKERRLSRKSKKVRPSRRITDYFDAFLKDKMGKNLIPGLRSLDIDFTVGVLGVGNFQFQIRRGCLTVAEPIDARSSGIHYEVDKPAFLEIVSGRKKPSELFFQRRIHISGDLYQALSTATALEDFFRLYPYARAYA